VICIKKFALFAEMGWTLKPGHGHYNDVIQIKGLFKCLEMHSIIQCVDAISSAECDLIRLNGNTV